ncbi:MAG: Xaa-Pro dipeptidase, partial [Blautia sp.]|nr:Xaa-Pro dipeptidase [Blautia sp.]
RAAVAAGTDSIEHGNYMNEETLCMLAESETVWVPTLVTVRNLRGCGRYRDETLLPIIRCAEENLRLAFRMGVHVSLGSDGGAYMVPHGQGLLDEEKSFCDILGDSPRVRQWLLNGEEQIRRRFCRT